MTIADIITQDIAQEFAGEIVARIDRFIEYAKLQVSATVFGDRYDLAVAYLAAHMLALANRNDDEGTNGNAGIITQRKEGDLSLSFALPNALNNIDGTLQLTSYGIEYERIRSMCVVSVGLYCGC